jgi:hypothetical protein
LQDRLVKELRLAGISDPEAGKTTLVNTILQILKAKPPGRDDHAAVLRAFDAALQGKIGLNAPAYRSPHRPSLGS